MPGATNPHPSIEQTQLHSEQGSEYFDVPVGTPPHSISLSHPSVPWNRTAAGKNRGWGKEKEHKQTNPQTNRPVSSKSHTVFSLLPGKKVVFMEIHQYKTNIYQSTLAHTEILWLLSFLNSAIESGIFALHTWSKHVQMVFLDRLGFEKEIEISDMIHQILGSYTAFKAENLHPMRYTHFSKQLLQ